MVKMAKLYREKWTAKYSNTSEYEELKRDYAEVLDRMTPEQIAAGLEQCLERFEWPPAPRDFYAAGKDALRAHAAHRQFKALPKPKPDKELGTKFLGHAHKILKGSKLDSSEGTGSTPERNQPGVSEGHTGSGGSVWDTEIGKSELQRRTAQQTAGSYSQDAKD